jgi:signal transduction histidine kinase
MRRRFPGRAVAFVIRLGSILGWYGLMSGLIALVAFGCGLVMLIQEYERPKRTEREVLHRVLANWVLAPDYLGKNVVDYAQDWRRAPVPDRGPLLDRVHSSLRQLGENLELHDALFPLITVVGLSLREKGGGILSSWRPRYAPGESLNTVADPIVIATDKGGPAISLLVQYQVAAEVDSVVEAAERYYNRMIRALIGLSGASLLCFGYMVLHVLGLRERVAREAAQEATLDLADRTCHELGNVAFVVANERRNLAGHIALLERFVAEEADARASAARRAGLDSAQLARFNHALTREYAEREMDPAFELRRSAAIARDVCQQIAVCSDYITLTVRELDGFLKRSELPVSIGPVVAAEVFEEALALLGPRLEAAGATVDASGLAVVAVRVLGDRRLLVHALVNLLKNAVEAASVMSSEPRVAVSARVSDETGWLEVVDNGPGISPADRRQIFEDGFSTKGTGRGRGLAIVQESIHLQGGRIEVATRPEGGTNFAVGLPLAR